MLGLIGKTEFELMIDSLREQYDIDVEYSMNMGNALGSDVGLYDNSVLSNSILRYLRTYFAPVDGFCEIEHYCYYCDFGRLDDVTGVRETSGELYDRLVLGLGAMGLFPASGV